VGRLDIITIDGPAGAGKSTAARRLAGALGFRYLDTGAIYRAVAWQARQLGVDAGNPEALGAFLEDIRLRVAFDAAGFHLHLDGREVSRELRTPEVSQEASRLSALPQVRRWVTAHLRSLSRDGGVVAEGRDLGSVVFPEAGVKFFLTADLATRAARRRREWQGDQVAVDLEQTITELAVRDRQDETRSASPLIVPDGAIVIDTTALAPEDVTQICLAAVRDALARKD
jgi:CMP/dCMP kinase